MDGTPLILPTCPALDALRSKVRLPAASENIFNRIIRNPHVDSETPRERESAEMLASLLINAPVARACICRKLADMAGQPFGESNIARFHIDTEQSIEGKRDDLRIETFTEAGGIETPLHLWTIEIKVGAGFHESSAIFPMPAEDGAEPDSVSQLENYDRWLQVQSAPLRAGFVLAVSDMACEIPADLKWRCLTWTGIGLILKEVLDADQLPLDERFLCRHVLGFIATHFWRNAQMPDAKLEFDDIALLRALARMRGDVQDKIRNLMKVVAEMMESTSFGGGKVSGDRTDVFGPSGAYVYKLIIPGEVNGPWLCAGIDGNSFGVWVWSPPRHKMRPALQTIFQSLKNRNSKWYCDESSEHPLCRDEPLTRLLEQADQHATFRKIMQEMFDDLDAAGFAKLCTPK